MNLRFRKNAAFTYIFWAGCGIFLALAAFDLYHYGKRVPVFFLGAGVGCAAAAIWGRGDLATWDGETLKLNLGLFNKQKIQAHDIGKIQIEADRFVKFERRSAAGSFGARRHEKVSLALIDNQDRAAFVQFARDFDEARRSARS